jgi:hypothetical protein
MRALSDEYWDWYFSDDDPDYTISGRSLFFFEDRGKLIEIAKNEIKNHDFHEAK